MRATCRGIVVVALGLTGMGIGTRGAVGDEIVEEVEIVTTDCSVADPVDILAWVTAPSPVHVGDAFTVIVTIENARSDAPFVLEEIEIAPAFMCGFDFLDAYPRPSEIDLDVDDLTLGFGLAIPAGRTQEIYVRMRARTSGVFVGDVDLWEEDDEFLTRTAQTRVLDWRNR